MVPNALTAIVLMVVVAVAGSASVEAAQRKTLCDSGFFECIFGGLTGSDANARTSVGSTGRSLVTGGRTRQTINWPRASRYKPGTIVISTSKRRLYYVLSSSQAIEYAVGVGREGFQWSGRARISRKAEWPGWTPPKRMIERERKKGNILPAHMPGGPNNPLGARALYLGGTLFRIHGTNAEHTIGGAVSSGCIRMMNNDVIDLYERVRIGAPVHVQG